MQDLFSSGNKVKNKEIPPLAYRMRPKTLDEFVGQDYAVGNGSFLKKALEKGKAPSLILWGPPGSGKTTLASIIAAYIKAEFISLSAVTSGIKEVKTVIEKAKLNLRSGRKTILFVDEIHRFNKAQQDGFLPHVENGTIIFIGATTENPSFEVVSALLSRVRVIKLEPLSDRDIERIVSKALNDKEKGLGQKEIDITGKAMNALNVLSNGDARVALNLLEMVDSVKKEKKYEITIKDIKSVAEKKTFIYDKNGEEHYNLISALHKSLRDSDPDGGLYWLVRMLDAGEDPLFIARRLIRFASEDVGNADPGALAVAINAKESYDFLGPPEGELALAQAAVYLACAPKSNSVYRAHSAALDDVRNTRDEPVPMHIRNAPTSLMKDMGYGRGYKYAHNYKGNYVKQEHLPDRLEGKKYYFPGGSGKEKDIKERLERWRKEQ